MRAMHSRISARSSAVARSAASVTAPISIARRRSSTSRQSERRRPPGLVSASGGSCTTNVPPPRPRTDVRCPDSTSVVIAWRSVEREIPSCSASSRSGGSRVPGPRMPRRIAVPRRSTVSSKVVGGWTGSKTAATAASRAMAPTYCARPVRVRTRNCPHRGGGRAYTRTMATTPTVIDRARIAELTEREAARLDERTQASKRMYERARDVLTAGVASSYQVRAPWPIYLERGDGPRVWDVDGNEMWDFHNGFGSMVQGHAHPAIGAAISARYAQGTHFAAPTEDAIVVGEQLKERWGLPRWRYTNSGSESTMDAIRIARAYTGRDTVLKIFGSYHGHHDTVMVSIGVEYDKIGSHDEPASLPYGAGIPQATVDGVFAVHFNDAESMERRIVALDKAGKKPACVIMEAAMMNLGVVLPEPGYLEAVRDITARHGIVLIFDEVKTGLCIAPGGATDKYGVRPDMVTLAKALGGGMPTGAIGMTAELAATVED